METNIQKSASAVLPTVKELKEALAANPASCAELLGLLFDPCTFVETERFAKRGGSEVSATYKSDEFTGVVTGYGAVLGKLAFAFAQDLSRMQGALDASHAKKISDLYSLAVANGAPVIGIFDSNGADIFEGAEALEGYAKIMASVASASGRVPQIAIVSGRCVGSFAAIASMFDLMVVCDGASFYVAPPSVSGDAAPAATIPAYKAQNNSDAAAYVRKLIDLIPQNATVGVADVDCADNANRPFAADLASAAGVLASIADCGDYLEIAGGDAPEISCAIARIGGVSCGICVSSYANNNGLLTAAAARKASKFIDFCDAFKLPLVSLLNSDGIAAEKENGALDFAPELARLSMSVAKSKNPKISVVLGSGIGAAFSILASKSIGFDICYATDSAQISALTASSSVAFAWNSKITVDVSRDELEARWRETIASPVAAASCGAVDDIISSAEIRSRVCSALYLLGLKGSADGRLHIVSPV